VRLEGFAAPPGSCPVFPRSVVVSAVPSSTAVPESGGRVPRHVWALLVLVVFVLGFAVGGSLRTVMTPASLTGHESVGGSALSVPVADVGVAVASTPRRTAAPTAVTQSAADRAAAVPFVRSAVRRGVPLPADSGSGRRIVYQQSTMHLWVVAADGTVIRDYPVTGRPGWPLVGTYHVFSKAVAAASPKYHVTFDWMVRFAHGHDLSIGFHSIPRFMGSGKPIQSESSLGAPIGHGGCVRQRPVDAKWLFGWADIGTTVVVLH
jgi:L,D-transpeptidase catalytic domain